MSCHHGIQHLNRATVRVLNTVVHGLEKVQQDPGDETSPYVPKGTSPRPQSKRYAFVGGVSTLGAYESVRTHSKTKRPTANGLATEITENGNGGKDVTATANGYGLATEITENGNGNGGKDVTATANGQRPTARTQRTATATATAFLPRKARKARKLTATRVLFCAYKRRGA